MHNIYFLIIKNDKIPVIVPSQCEPCREKTGFSLGENKGADQLRGNCTAD